MPLLRLAGVMGIERVDPSDARVAAACYDVFRAAERADDPHGFCMSAGVFANFLNRGWLGDPSEAWVVREADRTAAWYRISLPDMENTDKSQLALAVLPDHRRRGLGRELLRHARNRAVAAGRKTIEGAAWHGSPGEAFANAIGATPGLVDSFRVLAPSTLRSGHLAELRADAERSAGGYSLVSWPGPAPDELLEGVAGLYNALEEAPRNAGMDRPVWDARRIRERAEMFLHNTAIRRYSIAARHDATGDLVALTQIDADPGLDRWAHQGMTAVTGPHRGHRLGLLVKAVATQQFLDAEPDIERLVTMNAADNPHMIAINDALGYRPVRDQITWRLPC